MKNGMQTMKLLLINYAVLMTIIVTIELIGQLGYRLIKGRFLYETPPNTIFEEHPYLSGAPKKSIHYLNKKGLAFTTDQHGFRITRKNSYKKNGINIVCIGGSTTFGTFVTDEQSWPYKLQEKLGPGYNIYNLGVPGYTTLEGMIQLITFVPELNPHIVIIYEGWNDIRNYHIRPQSPDYHWHGMSQKNNLEFGNRTVWDYFFITKQSKNLGQILNPTSSNLSFTKGFPSNDPYIDTLYVRNLRTIKLLCTNLKTKMIFIPQVLNIDSLSRSPGTYPWTPLIENKQMPQLIEGFNSLMQSAIQIDENTIVVDNILRKYKWTKKHFVDFGHFSNAGGDFFIEIIEPAIRDLEGRIDQRKIPK